ncbi:MAG: hypothetical protein MJY97_07670 [Bacteroidales bacterium]|nr:hypothetical protein [Bacteroidales bacterium]
MILDDEIKIYLPKYLSAENYETLIRELKSFPDNIDGRMYTTIAEENLLCQGDVISNMPVVEIEHLDKPIKNKDCIILSNTCDINLDNSRLFPARIMYAPLVELKKYKEVLLKYPGNSEQKVNDHIASIKSQKISQILYLPTNGEMQESIVFLDRVLNIDSRYIDRMTLKERRVVSLSDYGFYMFLFKISVHFSRMQENVTRGCKEKSGDN